MITFPSPKICDDSCNIFAYKTVCNAVREQVLLNKDVQLVAITITFKTSTLGKNLLPYEQYTATRSILQKILTKKNPYVFIPELTLTGYVHYHGLYLPVFYKSLYKTVLPKLRRYGFVKIKKCDNPQGWVDYMTKDIHNNTNTIGRGLALTNVKQNNYVMYYQITTPCAGASPCPRHSIGMARSSTCNIDLSELCQEN